VSSCHFCTILFAFPSRINLQRFIGFTHCQLKVPQRISCAVYAVSRVLKCKNVNVKTIIVYKTISRCTGTERVKKSQKLRQEREKKWELRRERQIERDGEVMTCDGQLFHRRADAIGNALSSVLATVLVIVDSADYWPVYWILRSSAQCNVVGGGIKWKLLLCVNLIVCRCSERRCEAAAVCGPDGAYHSLRTDSSSLVRCQSHFFSLVIAFLHLCGLS